MYVSKLSNEYFDQYGELKRDRIVSSYGHLLEIDLLDYLQIPNTYRITYQDDLKILNFMFDFQSLDCGFFNASSVLNTCRKLCQNRWCKFTVFGTKTVVFFENFDDLILVKLALI